MTESTTVESKIIVAIKVTSLGLLQDVSELSLAKTCIAEREFFYLTRFKFEPLLQKTKNEIVGSVFRHCVTI